MAMFYQNLIRYSLIVMSLLTLGYSLFWDGWSFSGPLMRYSIWLQPAVFFLALVSLAYAVSKLTSRPRQSARVFVFSRRAK